MGEARSAPHGDARSPEGRGSRFSREGAVANGGEKEIAEKYLRVYCERQGCQMAYIQSWMSIVAAAELARGRVVEQDYLLSMVDVVDYY